MVTDMEWTGCMSHIECDLCHAEHTYCHYKVELGIIYQINTCYVCGYITLVEIGAERR